MNSFSSISNWESCHLGTAWSMSVCLLMKFKPSSVTDDWQIPGLGTGVAVFAIGNQFELTVPWALKCPSSRLKTESRSRNSNANRIMICLPICDVLDGEGANGGTGNGVVRGCEHAVDHVAIDKVAGGLDLVKVEGVASRYGAIQSRLQEGCPVVAKLVRSSVIRFANSSHSRKNALEIFSPFLKLQVKNIISDRFCFGTYGLNGKRVPACLVNLILIPGFQLGSDIRGHTYEGDSRSICSRGMSFR